METETETETETERWRRRRELYMKSKFLEYLLYHARYETIMVVARVLFVNKLVIDDDFKREVTAYEICRVYGNIRCSS